MKKFKIVVLFFLISYLTTPLFAEISILPYKIDSNSSSLKKANLEYSKLLSLAVSIKKQIVVTSPKDFDNDLSYFGISQNRPLTKFKLQNYGESRSIEYILTGTLFKTKNGFLTKSILYSIKEKKVLLKSTQSSSTLYSLATKELKNLLSSFPDKKISQKSKPIDIAFLLDSSYNSNKEMKEIKQSILSISKYLIDRRNIDSEIYLLPYSKNERTNRTFFSKNSILSISKYLKKIKPKGIAQGIDLKKSFKYATQSIKWRRESQKFIFIFCSSKMKDATFMERYAFSAKKKNIKVYAISSNKSFPKNSKNLKKICSITNGKHLYSTYTQTITDTNLTKTYLYLERGRLFTSSNFNKKWENGIFSNIIDLSDYSKSPFHLNENINSEINGQILPHQMISTMENSLTYNILSKNSVKNNIKQISQKLIFNSLKNNKNEETVFAKALVSNKNISIWIPITNKNMLTVFQKKEKNNFNFWIGFNIINNATEIYGIKFYPQIYKIERNYISNLAKANFNKIIKNKDFYINNGLFAKPLWFINVKIEKIMYIDSTKDIRD